MEDLSELIGGETRESVMPRALARGLILRVPKSGAKELVDPGR